MNNGTWTKPTWMADHDDPNGLAAVTRRLTELLERPDLKPELRAQIVRRLQQRDFPSTQSLQFEIDRITSTLDMAR